MVWPGSSFIILTGFLALIISTIVASVRYSKSRATTFYKGIFIRSGIVTLIGTAALTISGITLLEIKYGEYPEYIEAVKAVDQDPNNIELRRKEEEVYHKMINEIHGLKNN